IVVWGAQNRQRSHLEDRGVLEPAISGTFRKPQSRSNGYCNAGRPGANNSPTRESRTVVDGSDGICPSSCIEVNRARWKEIETLLLGIFIGPPRLIFAVISWFRHSETLSGFVLSDFYSLFGCFLVNCDLVSALLYGSPHEH